MRPRSLLPLFLAAASAARSAACHASDQPPLEISSLHFTLVTDAGEKQARHILDNFEHMRWMFQTLFPKTEVDPASPILIIAVKTRKGFESLEPAEYLVKGQLTLAGYFLTSPDKNLILVRLDAESEHPFATVYHEYTHLQFRSALEWMPLWLNEGVAEFFQNTEFRDRQVLVGEPSSVDILYLRQNKIIPLETLFRVDHNSPWYHQENKGSVFYAESWALTHYLEVADREKGSSRLSEYMQRVSHHEDPVTAAQEAFGDLKALQAQLSQYIQQQSYKQFSLSSAAAAIDPASYKLRTLTEAQFNADRADFLAYVGREQDARDLLQPIIAADPKNSQAREIMGYIDFKNGNQKAARKWFQEAIEQDSQSYLAHYYFAAMSLNDASSVSAPDSSPDPRIQSSLRTAIRLNPRFAPPYELLATLLAHSTQDTPSSANLDEARMLLTQAVELDPANLHYRISTANLLAMRSSFDDAERVLRAATPLARNASDTELLAQQIGQIENVKTSLAEQKAAQAASQSASPSAKPDPGAQVRDGALIKLPDGTFARLIPPTGKDQPLKHPKEPATGPKHVILGTIKNVECDQPAYLEFQVEMPGRTPASVYTADRYNLDLSSLGITVAPEMNPCLDLEGHHARVQYAETTDKTIDGQILLVELRK